MNVPNLITLSRLAVTAASLLCLELVDTAKPAPAMIWTAFALFLLAAGTDFVDGWLARRWNMVTAFGRVVDPFADKVLIAGVLISLLRFPAAREVLTGWFVVIVVAREFLVTAVRGLVEASGRAFPADRLGKWKMVAQCVTAAALLTMVAGSETWRMVAVVGFWISLLLTVVSGANYVWKARDILFAR